MVLRDNDNPGISIWWLRPIDEEDLALVEEENEQIIATQLKLVNGPKNKRNWPWHLSAPVGLSLC